MRQNKAKVCVKSTGHVLVTRDDMTAAPEFDVIPISAGGTDARLLSALHYCDDIADFVYTLWELSGTSFRCPLLVRVSLLTGERQRWPSMFSFEGKALLLSVIHVDQLASLIMSYCGTPDPTLIPWTHAQQSHVSRDPRPFSVSHTIDSAGHRQHVVLLATGKLEIALLHLDEEKVELGQVQAGFGNKITATARERAKLSFLVGTDHPHSVLQRFSNMVETETLHTGGAQFRTDRHGGHDVVQIEAEMSGTSSLQDYRLSYGWPRPCHIEFSEKPVSFAFLRDRLFVRVGAGISLMTVAPPKEILKYFLLNGELSDLFTVCNGVVYSAFRDYRTRGLTFVAFDEVTGIEMYRKPFAQATCNLTRVMAIGSSESYIEFVLSNATIHRVPRALPLLPLSLRLFYSNLALNVCSGVQRDVLTLMFDRNPIHAAANYQLELLQPWVTMDPARIVLEYAQDVAQQKQLELPSRCTAPQFTYCAHCWGKYLFHRDIFFHPLWCSPLFHVGPFVDAAEYEQELAMALSSDPTPPLLWVAFLLESAGDIVSRTLSEGFMGLALALAVTSTATSPSPEDLARLASCARARLEWLSAMNNPQGEALATVKAVLAEALWKAPFPSKEQIRAELWVPDPVSAVRCKRTRNLTRRSS